MRRHREAAVVGQAYDFVVWMLNHTRQFDRSHRHTLGTRIEDTALQLLDSLVEASWTKEKTDLLSTANRCIERLRILLRLAHELRLSSTDQYAHATRLLHTIGTAVGAWNKSRRVALNDDNAAAGPSLG